MQKHNLEWWKNLRTYAYLLANVISANTENVKYAPRLVQADPLTCRDESMRVVNTVRDPTRPQPPDPYPNPELIGSEWSEGLQVRSGGRGCQVGTITSKFVLTKYVRHNVSRTPWTQTVSKTCLWQKFDLRQINKRWMLTVWPKPDSQK